MRATNACDQCEDTGYISNPRLGRVRCPYCAGPKAQRVSPRELSKMLSASERRRTDMRALSSTLVVEEFKFPNVPNHLLSTDRVLTRWGGEGSGLPSENPDNYRISLPPPLDDRTHAEVSTLVKASASRVRDFTVDWYCSPMPVYVMAENRGMSRRQLGRQHVDVLGALKSRFLTSRHADLVALIRFIPE